MFIEYKTDFRKKSILMSSCLRNIDTEAVFLIFCGVLFFIIFDISIFVHSEGKSYHIALIGFSYIFYYFGDVTLGLEIYGPLPWCHSSPSSETVDIK